MNKLITTLIFVFIFFQICCAQSSLFNDEKVSRFSMHSEFSFSMLANSHISLNAEVKLMSSDSQDFQMNARVGFGYLNRSLIFDDTDESGYVGHLGIGLLVGQDNVFFEAYAGAINGSFTEKNIINVGSDKSYFKILPALDIGVRYQKPGAGVFYRIKLGLFGLGAGIGYAF